MPVPQPLHLPTLSGAPLPFPGQVILTLLFLTPSTAVSGRNTALVVHSRSVISSLVSPYSCRVALPGNPHHPSNPSCHLDHIFSFVGEDYDLVVSFLLVFST